MCVAFSLAHLQHCSSERRSPPPNGLSAPWLKRREQAGSAKERRRSRQEVDDHGCGASRGKIGDVKSGTDILPAAVFAAECTGNAYVIVIAAGVCVAGCRVCSPGTRLGGVTPGLAAAPSFSCRCGVGAGLNPVCGREVRRRPVREEFPIFPRGVCHSDGSSPACIGGGCAGPLALIRIICCGEHLYPGWP